MNTVDEVLDYAIDQEQQAADFYASMAERAEKAGMKKIFLDFAEEEIRHKERLLAVKAGDRELTPEQRMKGWVTRKRRRSRPRLKKPSIATSEWQRTLRSRHQYR